jgi:prepilin-type N-terminal cleavage/methylation domain-containing protein
MIHPRARRSGGQVQHCATRHRGRASGFSLLELLVATALAALLAAAIAAVVPSLQAYFEQTPAVIDLHQRGRIALDTVAQAIRTADRLLLLDSGRLMTIVPRINAGRGLLEHDQAHAGAGLLLSDVRCPAVAEVCGFVPGATAVIDDAAGRFNLFTVGSADPVGRSISPRHPFEHPYAAGASVVEVDAYTFRLDAQPDASATLVRETGAGAVQPIVDRVTGLRFAEAFGTRGVDVTMTLQSHGAQALEITRRIAVLARNVP